MNLLGDIGTIEWCRRTRGMLGRGERARFIAAVALETARVSPRLLAARAGARGSGPDPSLLTPPDTPFAREVVEACAEYHPAVLEHGYRSYLYARALKIAEDADCDDEALFAATMLHDHAFRGLDAVPDRCFAWEGAEEVGVILAQTSLDPSLQHDVLDAICLHLNPTVPAAERGVLQHLTHAGILVDALGVRAWELDPDGVARVADRHPRDGFVTRSEPLMRGHARRAPHCRTAALFETGFSQALRLGPWYAQDRAASSGIPAG